MRHSLRERLSGAARYRRPAALTALLALTIGIGVACGGDGAAGEATRVVASPAASTPAATPTALIKAARMLPVTPVSIDYLVADPAFEALPGARALFGEYEGGGYQIEVPENWNGDVVYFAHGFRGNPPQLTVGPPPLRDYLIAQGYAWAASSYTRNGYEPGAGARDTLALQPVFERLVGAPRYSYLYGQSMGGHVVTLSLEQFPQAYDGALSECGVVSGHEILDYFVSWGALASYFSGVELYGVTTDPGAFGVALKDRVLPALGPLDDPSDAGKAFASVIKYLSGGPRPFFREGYAANFNFNFVILVNAVGAAGPANAASQNVDARYEIDPGLSVSAETLNREVERISANTSYRDPETYPEFATMTGAIEVPLLTLHGTGDLFVPISLEQSYRRIVDAAGAGDLLVQRAVRRAGHCMFSEEERVRAFEDLVSWVERGAKPAGDDLTASLEDAGLEWTSPLEAGDPGGLQ